MIFYEKLDRNKYNKTVEEIIKKYKMIEIRDLKDCKGKKGIYILLQEKYKQMYIGQTVRDLKERIVRHWKKKWLKKHQENFLIIELVEEYILIQ